MQTKERNPMYTGERPTRGRAPGAATREQILYTPAKPFNRNRFLLHLATVAAVVLALVFCLSIFFKVGNVNVSGTVKYTPWEIKKASGIQDGDALISLSDARISANIRQKCPYVGDVRVGIKLPDTVNIEIKELEVVYAFEDSAANWWLTDGTGRIVDSTDSAAAKDYTRVSGVRLQTPEIGQQAIAAEPEIPTETTSETGITIATQPPIPESNKLDAAIQILTALESNGVMGNVDTVDVSDPQNLILQYENRYQVSLGDTSRLVYKIGAMKAAIAEMGEFQTGLLDVSFTIWPNEVGYRPFDGDSAAKK